MVTLVQAAIILVAAIAATRMMEAWTRVTMGGTLFVAPYPHGYDWISPGNTDINFISNGNGQQQRLA